VGFPMHPHRGIETVTYILAGSTHHRDSMGNAGLIGRDKVQWMTAGGVASCTRNCRIAGRTAPWSGSSYG
jgi:hypothetical protein